MTRTARPAPFPARIRAACRLALLLAALMICPALAGQSPRVYHAPNAGKAPFAPAPVAAESPLEPGADTLRVDFIDIGVGDAMLIACGGQRMLVDGGTADRYPRLKAYMEREGIRALEYMFVTHAHDDHAQGPACLARDGYAFGQALGMHARDYGSPTNLALIAALDEQHIPYRQVAAGDTVTLGGATLTFLNNPVRPANRTINAISMMLHVRFGEAALLLPADASGESLDYVAEHFPALMDVDILKSPHHGLNRLTEPFYQATQPELVVITANKAGGRTLSEQLLRRQVPHYFISMGTVRAETDGRTWYVTQLPRQ